MTRAVNFSELCGQRIFVAGGAGFIGSALCRELLDHGASVCAFDSMLHGCTANLDGLRLKTVQGDACDQDALLESMRSFAPARVVNCMGDTFVTTAYSHTLRFLRNNVEATHNLLRCATQCGVQRILHLSSTEVYDTRAGTALDEDTPLNPVNSYAVTKLAADRLCATMSSESRCPVLIARIFNCYGPRETHAYVIPEIIQQLDQGTTIRLGALHAARDFTFVHDTVRALAALLLVEAEPATVVNVGSGKAHTVAEVAEELAAIMRPEGFDLVSDERLFRRREIGRFLCNGQRLHKLTGWQPRVGLSEGLRRTVDWFNAHDHRWPWKHARVERSAQTDIVTE